MRRAGLVIAMLGAPAAARADEPAPAPAIVREVLVPERLWDLAAADGSWITGARRALGFSTTLEHRWTLDGIPVDAVHDGSPELRVPLAFLSSLDVITGGMPASARASTGAVIDGHLRGGRHDHGEHVRGWLGTHAPVRTRAASADRLAPITYDETSHGSAAVVYTNAEKLPTVARWRPWIFFGVGAQVDREGFDRDARRLRDDDGDGRYDRDVGGTLTVETVDRRSVAGYTLNVSQVLRVGGTRGRHQVALTGISTWGVGTGHVGSGTVESTAQSLVSGTAVAAATWTTRWDHTELTLSASWLHARHTMSGADGVQIATAYIPAPADLEDDAALAAACVDDGGLPLCPVATFYRRGGAGLLEDTVSDRPTTSAEVSRRFDAGGRHRVAAGATMEDARWRRHRRYTGGVLEERLSEDIVITTRFRDAADETYRTRSMAAYLEDAWQPAPGMSFQGGLRWETMEVGDALRLVDQLAPRVGVAMDPTRSGKVRVYMGWARYFQLLRAGVGPRAAGETAVVRTTEFGGTSVETVDERGPRSIDLPAIVEETVVGAEWSTLESLAFGISGRARRLHDPVRRRDTFDTMAWFGNSPDAGVHVRVGWARSRQHGSWTGTEVVFEGHPNAVGRLPLDRPHRLFVESIVRRARGRWTLVGGGRFEIASGRPVSAFASGSAVPLIPRGTAGRMPTTSAVHLHLGATRGRWSFGLDLIDAFHRRAPEAVDEVWTTADAQPIDGGDLADLIWLCDENGTPVPRRAGFGKATRYQPPLTARLSLTFTY